MIDHLILYYDNGKKSRESWKLGTYLHREDGPANINYYYSGVKQNEYYCLNNNLHREDGPAFTSFYYDGSVIYKTYHLHGRCVEASSDEEFKKIVKLKMFL